MTRRDRDPEGRALNARPRDALGRPLPRGSRGVSRIPENARFTPDEALAIGQRLLDDGKAFHAHEVFESAWKHADPESRWLWRALAQLAVGITHVQRGNPPGAIALLRRAAAALAEGEPAYDVDAEGLAAAARSLAATLEAGDPVGPELRPSLTRRR